MRNKLKKDHAQRLSFSLNEISYLIRKAVNKSDLGLRINENKSVRTKIRNRCLWTGRGRGIFKDLQMSRMVLKLWGDGGKIQGLRKR